MKIAILLGAFQLKTINGLRCPLKCIYIICSFISTDRNLKTGIKFRWVFLHVSISPITMIFTLFHGLIGINRLLCSLLGGSTGQIHVVPEL